MKVGTGLSVTADGTLSASGSGTVTSVTGTAPITSSGGATPAIGITAATTSAAGSMSAADKTKLDGIAADANNYVLPAATGSAIGGVKTGTNIAIATDGTISANLPGALIYKGTTNLTGTAPGAKATGDVYVNTTAGTVDGSWNGLSGTATVGEMVLWDGAKWDAVGNGGAAGVTAVTGTSPVVVGGTAQQPDISVSAATTSAAGLLSAADKTKLDGIAAGAAAGTVTTVTATSPIHVATATTTPALTIDDASTTAKGVVQLADAAAVTAGTAGRVVTADQLKTTNDAIAGGITTLTGTAPVTVTAGANAQSKVIAVDTATNTATGVMRLATDAEATAGTLETVAVNPKQLAAVTIPQATRTAAGKAEIATESEITAGTDDTRFISPKGAKTTLMPYDISTLTALP